VTKREYRNQIGHHQFLTASFFFVKITLFFYTKIYFFGLIGIKRAAAAAAMRYFIKILFVVGFRLYFSSSIDH